METSGCKRCHCCHHCSILYFLICCTLGFHNSARPVPKKRLPEKVPFTLKFSMMMLQCSLKGSMAQKILKNYICVLGHRGSDSNPPACQPVLWILLVSSRTVCFVLCLRLHSFLPRLTCFVFVVIVLSTLSVFIFRYHVLG